VDERVRASHRARCDPDGLELPNLKYGLELETRLLPGTDDRDGRGVLPCEQVGGDAAGRAGAQIRQVAVVQEQAGKGTVDHVDHDHQAVVQGRPAVGGVDVSRDLDRPDRVVVEVPGLDMCDSFG